VYYDTWRPSDALPFPLSDMTANTVGDKIYLMGGCSSDQIGYVCPSISTDVFIYDVTKGTYETLTNVLPRARYRHATALIGTKLYLMGGRDLSDNIIEEVDIFETTDQTWTTSPYEWTSAQSDNDAFVLDGKIYAIGGYDATYTATDKTDILEPDVGWTLGSAHTTIAPMTVTRGDFAVVEGDGDLVYAFGGWSDSNNFCTPLTSAEVYDPSADTWTAIADLEVGRGDKASGALHGRIFAVGGENQVSCDSSGSSVPLAAAAVTDVEAYNPSTDKWEVVADMPESAFRFASATWKNTIFIFGGQKTARFCVKYNASCNELINATWGFTEEAQNDRDGLPAGAIAGIVIACMVAVFAAVTFIRRGGACACGGNSSAPSRDAIEVNQNQLRKFKANDAGDFEAGPNN